MNMEWLMKKRISWRVIVLLIIAIAILSYMVAEAWKYYNYMNKLHDDGWYIVTICSYNYNDAFIMIDANNTQELYEDIHSYSIEIKNHPEIKKLIEDEKNSWRIDPVPIYFLIPNDEIKFGKKSQCHHGLYINDICNLCRENAVAKILIDPLIPIDEQPWQIIEINQ